MEATFIYMLIVRKYWGHSGLSERARVRIETVVEKSVGWGEEVGIAGWRNEGQNCTASRGSRDSWLRQAP